MHPSSIYYIYLDMLVICAHFIDDDESDDVTPSVVITHEKHYFPCVGINTFHHTTENTERQ